MNPISDFGLVNALCGPSVATALHSALAGERVYVPKRPRPDASNKITIIGAALASLSRHFGGGAFYVPRNPDGAAARRRQIVAMWRAGHSTAYVAAKLSCSRRLVQHVTQSLRAAVADEINSDAGLTGVGRESRVSAHRNTPHPIKPSQRPSMAKSNMDLLS